MSPAVAGRLRPAEGREAGRTAAWSRELCRGRSGAGMRRPGGTRLRLPGSGGSVRAAGAAVTRGLRDSPHPVLGASGSGPGRNFIWDLAGRVRVLVGTGLGSKSLNSSFGENLYNSRHKMLSFRTYEHQIFKMKALLKALQRSFSWQASILNRLLIRKI